jgi:hypothetical protein
MKPLKGTKKSMKDVLSQVQEMVDDGTIKALGIVWVDKHGATGFNQGITNQQNLIRASLMNAYVNTLIAERLGKQREQDT